MVHKNVAEILSHHLTFELEAIDRMYLNAYVPSLQTGAGLVYFLKTQLGVRVPSTVMVAPMSQRFVDALERFAETQRVDLVTFKKGERKDDMAKQYLATFEGDEGILFVGKAQEKASVFRTTKRRDAQGKTYPCDHSLDDAGQSLLRLRSRPRLRPVVPQGLHVLSLRREALPERARVAQTAAHATRHPLRAARQWHPIDRGGGPRPTHRRHL